MVISFSPDIISIRTRFGSLDQFDTDKRSSQFHNDSIIYGNRYIDWAISLLSRIIFEILFHILIEFRYNMRCIDIRFPYKSSSINF